MRPLRDRHREEHRLYLSDRQIDDDDEEHIEHHRCVDGVSNAAWTTSCFHPSLGRDHRDDRAKAKPLPRVNQTSIILRMIRTTARSSRV